MDEKTEYSYTSALFEIEVRGSFDFGNREKDERELVTFRRTFLTRAQLYALLKELPGIINTTLDRPERLE